MSDFKDSAIKLFGKTITLPVCYDPHLFSVDISSLHHNTQYINKESSGKEEDTTTARAAAERGGNKKPKTSSPEAAEIESLPQTTPEKVGEEEEENNMKKPDKILACPRCNSMDTKFCYYNNYNVNQPRHFCKKCQRYWTAGGTVRNVPVGAGRRRKNKNSTASHFRHLILSQSLRAAQLQAALNSTNNSTTLLTFGRDHQTDIFSDKEQAQAVGQNNQRFIAQNRSGLAVSFYPSKQYTSANFLVRDGLFNGFSQSKTAERSSSLLLLQANPAALCRSLNFQETN